MDGETNGRVHSINTPSAFTLTLRLFIALFAFNVTCCVRPELVCSFARVKVIRFVFLNFLNVSNVFKLCSSHSRNCFQQIFHLFCKDLSPGVVVMDIHQREGKIGCRLSRVLPE